VNSISLGGLVVKRLVAGFLVTPPLAALVAWLLLALAAAIPHLAGYLPPVLPLSEDVAFIVGWSLLIAVIVTGLGVVPLALKARARAAVTISRVVLAGVALGASPFVLLFVVAVGRAIVEAERARIAFIFRICGPFMVLGSITGALTAAAFFFVALRRNPLLREPA
jgi:hypothetical protein